MTNCLTARWSRQRHTRSGVRAAAQRVLVRRTKFNQSIIPPVKMTPAEEARILEELLAGRAATKGGRQMHIAELEAVIEDELAEAVQRHYPLDWKEDAITHDLIIRFRNNFRDITLRGLRYPVRLEWEAYKLHGRRETSHGDVGMLIRYRLPSGADVEAAGFLEAKVRGRDSTKFHQVRHEQVDRILKRSPRTRLLLYDYNPVPVLGGDAGHDPEWDWHPRPIRRWRVGQTPITHGPTLPLELAAAVNQYDDGLYRFAHSLSFQIARRFFQLHDVDFREAAVQAVKGFPSDLGSPNFVMIVRAAALGQDLPEALSPNDNVYGRFE